MFFPGKEENPICIYIYIHIYIYYSLSHGYSCGLCYYISVCLLINVFSMSNEPDTNPRCVDDFCPAFTHSKHMDFPMKSWNPCDMSHLRYLPYKSWCKYWQCPIEILCIWVDDKSLMGRGACRWWMVGIRPFPRELWSTSSGIPIYLSHIANARRRCQKKIEFDSKTMVNDLPFQPVFGSSRSIGWFHPRNPEVTPVSPSATPWQLRQVLGDVLVVFHHEMLAFTTKNVNDSRKMVAYWEDYG